MTVREQAEQTFNIEPRVLAAHVRYVLTQNKEYRSQTENADQTVFTTNVKPFIPGIDWLLLGTRMTISIHSNAQTTRMIVSTKSQPFIVGDAAGMYERYVRDFFAKLQLSLEQVEVPTATGSKPVIFKKSNNWWSVLVLCLITLVASVILIQVAIRQGPIFLVGISLFVLLISLTALIQAIRGLRDHT